MALKFLISADLHTIAPTSARPPKVYLYAFFSLFILGPHSVVHDLDKSPVQISNIPDFSTFLLQHYPKYPNYYFICSLYLR